MPTYRAPRQDIDFLLNDVFQADQLFSSMPGTQDASVDLTSAIVDEAAKIAEGLLAPINHSGDQEGCRYDDGVVTTPKGFQQAYNAYAEGGWAGLTGETAYGGQGMPKTLSALIEEMSFAANSSFALFTILTTGATLTLSQHGSEELKQRYLPKMYAGTWTGTMCLTEPHAGTDLGMIKTRAVPCDDGSFKLTGTKIFITGGEHDLAENIIHLVLAKLPDAPAGPRGISLFLVPKMAVNQSGELTGAGNGVRCGSIEHKMGIKASPTCVMNFDEATGYLVGELNNGLSHMFTMMNYERLSMGLQANGLADSAYQVAADYAKERVQGRAPKGPQQPEATADPLLVHPDVRRLLLTIRANVLAGRSLSIFAAMQLDVSRFHPEPEARARADKLVSLLIPVQKAYCTDRGFDACVMAQQVLGGHGYVAEWGLEQNVRDARIAQIYEGANGIQALDLMGRKTVRANGQLLALLSEEMDAFVAEQAGVAEMQGYLQGLAQCREALQSATDFVIERAAGNPEEIGAASYAYMELMGLTLYCFMWQKIMASALKAKDLDSDYTQGLIKVGEFFLARQVPKAQSLLLEIEAGSESLMAMTAAQF
ncbi:acyl-CoA dehydrogenase C-terminal domain-containing protein [Gammaproteobacteria bacterium]|nr:acyl-CoA dehydrogenase C-terminal domain-containing protein [Gammaproteobacteria bacterium]